MGVGGGRDCGDRETFIESATVPSQAHAFSKTKLAQLLVALADLIEHVEEVPPRSEEEDVSTWVSMLFSAELEEWIIFATVMLLE